MFFVYVGVLIVDVGVFILCVCVCVYCVCVCVCGVGVGVGVCECVYSIYWRYSLMTLVCSIHLWFSRQTVPRSRHTHSRVHFACCGEGEEG